MNRLVRLTCRTPRLHGDSLRAAPSLANLHAKLAIIDEDTVYCGSANWYRYSLLESHELVLRGPAAQASGLLDQIQVIWEASGEEQPTGPAAKDRIISKGYTKEVIDPVAEAKLKEVPGSFVIGYAGRQPRKRK